jgi:trans-aconitate methyltransferase
MSAIDFSQRAELDELMDTDCTGFEDYRDCLADLARVNRASLAYRPTLDFVSRLPRGRELHVVDVGCGYGDMLRVLDTWAQRRGVALRMTGLDRNPWAARAAAEATRPGRPIQWVTADVFEFEPRACDVVISSLFTHHLSEAELVRFLRWMEAWAELGWFVNDLHRHPLPYHVFRYGSRLAGWHRFVQHDGPISIARAFSRADWVRLLAEVGLNPQTLPIRWWMPFRLCVERLETP